MSLYNLPIVLPLVLFDGHCFIYTSVHVIIIIILFCFIYFFI